MDSPSQNEIEGMGAEIPFPLMVGLANITTKIDITGGAIVPGGLRTKIN